MPAQVWGKRCRGAFPWGVVGEGFGIVTVGAWVSAVVWDGSLAWELSHDTGVAKKKKKKDAGERGLEKGAGF